MEASKGKYVRTCSTEDTRWKSLRRGGREVAEEEEEGRRNIATDREGLITKVNLELEGIPAVQHGSCSLKP